MNDILIIGAGISGIYSLYLLRKRFPTWNVKIVEAGSDVGGVWFWNSYPGCRIDTESLSYCFSFDKDLLEEWTWKDTFATQADTLEYLKYVARKHDLYKDIQFNTRIKAAQWNGTSNIWTFTDESGNEHETRFFISCLGFLSSPTLPNIPGIDEFGGKAFHTSRWPEQLDMHQAFAGKRIGVIGTGATGIQMITAVSKEPAIKSLTVFQRTANWSAPLHNRAISPEQMNKYRTEFDSIFDRCSKTPSCFLHEADPRSALEVTDEERTALYEKIYSEPGFSKWLGVFKDTYTDHQANSYYSNFMADKIRARVTDPVVAETLIPKDHGFGSRRVPLESGYFEAFNRPNVHLVDLRKNPIDRLTPTGILTSDGTAHPLDILIFATGFDAITGAFTAIDWSAKDGRPLTDVHEKHRTEAETPPPIWKGLRPKTFLGLTIPSMPNTFLVLGPHQPLGNATRSVEHAVEVIADLLQFCEGKGYTFVEPTEEAVEAWTEHVIETSKKAVLVNEVDSWMTGVNRNVLGKTVRNVVRYSGSAVEYRRRCGECKEGGYEGLEFA